MPASVTQPQSSTASREALSVTGSPDKTGPSESERRRRGSLAMLMALPAPLRLVIITQFAFNVGFYLVVPFIAAHLAKDLLLAEWIIGLLLGLRTFSQQGMFFLGGALADRFGIKNAIIVGCVIRICGFLALTGATWPAPATPCSPAPCGCGKPAARCKKRTCCPSTPCWSRSKKKNQKNPPRLASPEPFQKRQALQWQNAAKHGRPRCES